MDNRTNRRDINNRNVPERRSRNVDVAETRRKSGNVDVFTGRRLDGRVQVPVDRRKQPARNPERTRAADDRNAGTARTVGRSSSDERRRQRTPDERTRQRNTRRRQPGGRERVSDDGRKLRSDGSVRRPDPGAQRGGSAGNRRSDGRESRDRLQAEDRARQRNDGRRADPGRTRRENADRRAQDQRNSREQERRRRNADPGKNKKKKQLTRQEIERQKKLKEEKLRRRKERNQKIARIAKIVLKVLLVLVILCAIAFVYIKTCYKLKNIEVSGTDHYTDKQMVDIVTGGNDYGNTLLFLLESRLHPAENVTFIDKIDISYIDRNTVSITVYEKAMAGCIKYNDQYAYFDGEGTVLEISDEKLDDVPCIEGIESDNVVQGQKLDVGDNSFFQEILTMTQLIYKNNIQIDKITCDSKQNLILHRDGIKINIGTAENLESKLMNLEVILESVKGKKGTLDMSSYSPANGSVIFKENK